MIKTSTREASMLHTHNQGYLTVAEAATRLQVSHPTIWRWIKSGKLAAYRVGPKAIRIKEADLAALVQPVGRSREEVSMMRETTSMETAIDAKTLTDEERRRALATL